MRTRVPYDVTIYIDGREPETYTIEAVDAHAALRSARRDNRGAVAVEIRRTTTRTVVLTWGVGIRGAA